MDELDRLYVELVESLREHGRDLDDAVTVRELHEELIPYRRVRDRVGFRSNGDYQATLSRLLSGERGYLEGDGVMQESVIEALSAPVPDARRFRAFPDAEVQLVPGEVPPPGDTRYAPPEVRRRAVRRWRGMGSELDSDPEAGRMQGVGTESGESSGASSPSAAGGAGKEHGDVVPDDGGQRCADPSSQEGEDEKSGPDPGIADDEAVSEVEEARALTGRSVCPACGSDLPDHPSRHCPYCGHGPIEACCAGCGTSLRQDWKYCPECGRGRGFETSNSA